MTNLQLVVQTHPTHRRLRSALGAGLLHSLDDCLSIGDHVPGAPAVAWSGSFRGVHDLDDADLARWLCGGSIDSRPCRIRGIDAHYWHGVTDIGDVSRDRALFQSHVGRTEPWRVPAAL